VAADQDLSVGDWEALSVLVRSGGKCTPSEMTQALQLTSGTISVRLNRLVAAGYIEVVPDSDGRSRPVVATDEGHKRWKSATPARTREESGLFAVLSHADHDILNEKLRTLLANYERALGEASRNDASRAYLDGENRKRE
jgi:DNA-binding MarR family transcriptional regulator